MEQLFSVKILSYIKILYITCIIKEENFLKFQESIKKIAMLNLHNITSEIQEPEIKKPSTLLLPKK